MSEEKKNIFVVMGHGYEDVVDFEKRTILPEGYNVVTFCECGDFTTLSRVCPLYPYFVDGSDRIKNILLEPEQLKREYPQYTMHIYKSGSYIPSIKTTLKMVWNKFYREPKLPSRELGEGETEEEHTTVKYVCKSGVYKYPVDETTLFDKERDDMCNHTGWCAEIPEGEDITKYMSKAKQGSLEMRPSPYGYTLDDIMRKFGPGTYYLPICRTAKCEDDIMEQKIRLTRQLSTRQQEKQEKGLMDKVVVKSFPLRPLDKSRMIGRINVLERQTDLSDEQKNELENLKKQVRDDDDLRALQRAGRHPHSPRGYRVQSPLRNVLRKTKKTKKARKTRKTKKSNKSARKLRRTTKRT